MGDEEILRAMDWVIPADSSSGAGQEVVLTELRRIVGDDARYWQAVALLSEEDLGDSTNPFAKTFKDNVRDAYYAVQTSGAWEDIGFRP